MADLSPYIIQYREKFQDISCKFASVVQKHSPNTSEQINELVEEVITFVKKAPCGAVIYPDFDIVLTSFGNLVSSQTPQLLIKLCHFICCLVEKHNVTLRDELNEKIINMCLQGLRRSNSYNDSESILKAVEMLIRADRNHLLKQSEILQSLVMSTDGILLQIISSTETPGPLLLAAVGCLELLMLPSSSNSGNLTEYQKVMSEISESCMNALICVLGRGKPTDLDDLGYYKLVIASMRCLHHIVSPTAAVPPPVALTTGRLGELIGIFRAFLALGLPGTSNNIKYPVGPFKAQSSSVALPVPVQALSESKDEYKGRTTKALRKNRKKTSKKGAEVLVDSLEQEKPDLSPRNNRLGMDTAKNESPKLPHWNLTSDSDMSSSDVESGRSREPEGRSALSRVRQMACSLLLCLVQVTEPSVLFSFWPSLLPDGMPTGPGFILPKPLKYGEEATLATLILSDPSSKGRAVAAIVLASLLNSWQRFLVQAECSRDKKTMSFTPFSVALGWSLCSIHRDMCLAFASEMSTVAISQLLRCCTALVLASSYHKLASGHLHRLVSSVRPMLRHRDPTVVGGVLSLFGAIISLDPTPPEVVQIFTRSSSSKLGSDEVADVAGVPSFAAIAQKDEVPVEEEDTWDNEFYDDEEDQVNSVVGVVEGPVNSVGQSELKHSTELKMSRAPAGLPWIMEACLQHLSLKDRSSPITVQTECLQALLNIAKNHELVTKLFFDSEVWPIVQSRFVLGPGIIIDGGDTFPLKFHWGKFWEGLGLAIQKIVENSSKESAFTVPQAVTYWQALLSGSALVPFIQDMDTPSIRAVGCDVLATIGSSVFGHLTRDKQILCETLLFGSSRDEEPAVKSAALRALGIYTLYPCLREDLLFLLDTCDTLQSALDGDASRGEVWSKASWALGNLCDALVRNREEGFSEELPEGSLLELLEACAASAQPLPKSGSNGDRVRFNGVRAAGSVIRLIDFRGWDEMAGSMSLFSLGKRGKEMTEKVVVTLVEAATKSSNMKVRWNACYSISSMLKNTSLYSSSGAYDDLVTKTKVFPALNSLVRDFCNLKVRINAALALSSPSRHANYGQRNFLEAWKALLEGLDNTQRSCFDITGYNHQSNLIDQIILTLCHLANLVEKTDLAQLGEILDPYLENTQAQMLRRSQTLVPEKASRIEEAASHLASMKKSPNGNTVCFTRSEEEGLSKLLKVFSIEEIKLYGPSPL
ncbi:HEAT repeat-containing protein 6 [Ischnura elegans]|uniref:HEAT repeat-containing protein 6 n=1 Tax=Ischnura elegans TaxID=197161 RepID=UPI001ED883CD|nr:HEAT repeat-containing protein 6 [Ischnura elegans]